MKISREPTGRASYLRVPQRGRAGLRAFTRDLRPMAQEVGIDRFSLTVSGSWRAHLPERDNLTPEGYFELLTSPCEEPAWFRTETKGDGTLIRSRASADNTLGDVKVLVRGRQDSAGPILIKLEGGNVTRTLAHLLAMHGHHGSAFADVAGRLDPLAFFSKAPDGVPPAYGRYQDNWINDYGLMRGCLGADPFGSFLPIYVAQLQRLAGWLILPHDQVRIARNGSELVSSVPGIACRVEWGRVRVPQAEAYFERHHSHAQGAVRLLASAALIDFDDAEVWRYVTNSSIWVERADDGLSVGFSLRETYRLVVYAKAPGRIRLEVRRTGKGIPISPSEGPASPEGRLLTVMARERLNLLTAVQWGAVGALLEEHQAPQMSDLIVLCNAVHRACITHAVSFEPVIRSLLIDGGIKPNGAQGFPSALIDDLCLAGILHRPSVRRRDHRHPNKRYALRPEFRGLINLISRSLLVGHGLTPERP